LTFGQFWRVAAIKMQEIIAFAASKFGGFKNFS
jgi:hypothetical protein